MFVNSPIFFRPTKQGDIFYSRKNNNSVSGERIALYTSSEGSGDGESTEGKSFPYCESKMLFPV